MAKRQSGLGQAIVFITGDLQGLNKSLGDAQKLIKQRLGNILPVLDAVGKRMALAGAAMGGALALAVRNVEKLGSSMHDLAEKTGASTEFLSGLKYAAESSGGSIESVATAFKKLQKAIVEGDAADEEASEKGEGRRQKMADDLDDLQEQLRRAMRDYRELMHDPVKGASKGVRERREALDDRRRDIRKMYRDIGDARDELEAESAGKFDAFAAIGLERGALGGLTPEQQFLAVARALAEVKDKTLQVAAAQKLWGKSGTDLLPMLEGGAEQLERTLARAKELGLVFTADARVIDAYGDSLTDLRTALQSFLRSVLVPILPALTRFVTRVVDAVIYVRRWAEANKELVRQFVAAWGALAAFLVGLGALLHFASPIITALGVIGAAFSALWLPIRFAVVVLAGAVYAWKKNLLGFREWIVPFMEGMELTFRGGWGRIFAGVTIDLIITITKMKEAWLEFGLWYDKNVAHRSPARIREDEERLEEVRVALQRMFGDKAALDASKLAAIGGKTFVQQAVEDTQDFVKWMQRAWAELNRLKGGLGGERGAAGGGGGAGGRGDARDAARYLNSIKHPWPQLDGLIPMWNAAKRDANGMVRSFADLPHNIFGEFIFQPRSRQKMLEEIANQNFGARGSRQRLGHQLAGESTVAQRESMAQRQGKAIAKELAKVLKPAKGLFVLSEIVNDYDANYGQG